MSDAVLIVDDEQHIRQALHRLLRREGYEIHLADGGPAALEILARQEIAVLICDQRMPGMVGAQVLAEAYKLCPDTVRITLTGYTDLASVQASINEGHVNHFLLKPWDDDHLRTVVRERVEAYRLVQENRRLESLARRQKDEVAAVMQRVLADSTAAQSREAEAATGREDEAATGREDEAATGREAAGAGRQRLGEYELLGQLGAGGMGVVYQARQVFLNRLVALKILAAEQVANRRSLDRFLREMGVVGQLNHPNVVAAHDAREVSGTYFLAMEFVAGVDFDTLVHDYGPLPVPEACELTRQAAVGLQYIHEHHLVHRDIKPSNLMVTPAGVVKVLDLGLALLAADRPAAEQRANAGQALGTVDYMAPEQVRDAHQVDHRADLYSLGCTLYQLLTGRTPFGDRHDKDPLRRLLSHLDETPPPVRQFRPEIPGALGETVQRLLAKQPADRFATAAEVAETLQPFTAGCNLAGLLASEVPVRPGPRVADHTLAPTMDLVGPFDASGPGRAGWGSCGTPVKV